MSPIPLPALFFIPTPAAAAAAIFFTNLIFCIPTRYFFFQPLQPLQPLFLFPTLFVLFQLAGVPMYTRTPI